MDARVFADLDALSRGALEEWPRVIRGAIQARGRFEVALAGGHTPATMYAFLAGGGATRDVSPFTGACG